MVLSLALGLQQNNTIKTLDLNNNCITGTGLESLNEFLVPTQDKLPSVKEINLSGNSIEEWTLDSKVKLN